MTRRILALVLLAALLLISAGGCAAGGGASPAPGPEWSGMTVTRQVPLRYATQFTLTEYEGGYILLDIPATGRFLLVPEGGTAPQGLAEDVTPLQYPVSNIYLTATSAMDFFRALDGIGNLRLSGTDRNGWYIPEAQQAMDEGKLLFAGKYSMPDFELICGEKCRLAIESTMIYHAPEIEEQLEALGIPVLVERSSYEPDPLGRMEWLKVYAALLGKLPEAEELFDAETRQAEALLNEEQTGKTVAFFFVNSTGTVNVRRTTDYVPRMIEMAGGQYVFQDLKSDDTALSTLNMTMEAFYEGARNADVLIYNSSIDAELYTMEEFLEKSPLLADFKAVATGDVWCTGKNLFQEPMGLARLITDFHRVLTGDVPEDGKLDYLHKVTN